MTAIERIETQPVALSPVPIPPPAPEPSGPSVAYVPLGPVKLSVRGLHAYYGDNLAVRNVDLEVARGSITAIIGPSGCGKSTLLRSVNRMNDLIPGFHSTGSVLLDGEDLLGPEADPIAMRRRVGMLFQRPNPFPASIFDNVAYGLRIAGRMPKRQLSEAVENALERAALLDEVKDRLDRSALGLSGGQQQRLCLARALAVDPEVILMDEPCSALDPIATLRIEDLMRELTGSVTQVIVTHNMQQAARVSDCTAFMLMGKDRAGELVEYGPTVELFRNPRDRRTEDYITGRFG
ncbi:MAG TPA: phosphate ABC transporter ATP-binding protein PstB [Candidatus Dormibacteraeota bacterium]|jgi:phosphate transport system ATP-binding protein|nr:phosphate ABC transporter ATP-binding protein PstB [Candidatus Dormibacteraeota bacterium]